MYSIDLGYSPPPPPPRDIPVDGYSHVSGTRMEWQLHTHWSCEWNILHTTYNIVIIIMNHNKYCTSILLQVLSLHHTPTHTHSPTHTHRTGPLPLTLTTRSNTSGSSLSSSIAFGYGCPSTSITTFIADSTKLSPRSSTNWNSSFYDTLCSFLDIFIRDSSIAVYLGIYICIPIV